MTAILLYAIFLPTLVGANGLQLTSDKGVSEAVAVDGASFHGKGREELATTLNLEHLLIERRR